VRIPQRVVDTTTGFDEQLEQLRQAAAESEAIEDAAAAVLEQAEAVLDVARGQTAAACRDLDRYMRTSRSRT